ncbi:MAG: protein jag [Candidatus Eiseniibacteriota bacterium]|nr:MAG: protein jag [Candidatus Eisenbacteria bacterium]
MDEHRRNCIETEGKTVGDAVGNALKRLGVEEDDVEIEVLDEGSRGVFSILGSRQARVRVRLKIGLGPSSEPAELVRELLSAMGFSAEVESKDVQDATEITIGSTGADGLLIGKRGETLECFQHVVSKMLNRNASSWRHVIVDVGGYRKRREGQLMKLASSLAERASSTGQEVSTDPLKASERRIIHLALKDHPGVRSFAVGEGLVKRVVIGPKDTGRS